MSSEPRDQALQSAYEMLSEQFPHVALAVEAQIFNAGAEQTMNQMLRWYGDSTTATGLLIYASDFLSRRFGANATPPNQAAPPPPLRPPQDDALVRAAAILGEHFSCAVIVAQSEGEFIGSVERSIKVLRCSGGATAASGLALFASNALRKMALE